MNKRHKILRAILYLTFVPYVIHIGLTIYYMIVGMPWFMYTYIKGLEVLAVSGIFYIGLWYIYLPILLYQIFYLVCRKEIKGIA